METNNAKSYTVVWLGTQRPNVEEENILHEEDAIKHILYFDDEDTDTCLRCLQLISNENVLLVIIGMASRKIVLDENILAQFHNFYQVKSIYVDAKYCNQHPSQLFPKMKYMTSHSLSLRIQADLHVHARVTEPFVFNTLDERSSLTMNGDFMHFQMLINSFIHNRFHSELLDDWSTFAKSKNEFIKACKEIYKNAARTSAKIEEFEHTYTSGQALYWYTKETFVYPLLNKALRTNDTRLILLFRFFILDLYNQLDELRDKPFTPQNKRDLSPIYFVYRRQLMSKHELNSLRKSLGNVISIKSFLSTSLNRQAVLDCLGENDDPSELLLIRVLIEIDLGNDNYCSSKMPFANITEQSYFGEEEEVLFMVSSCFRVDSVRRGEKGIWYVRLATLNPFEYPFGIQSKWGTLYRHMESRFLHPMLIPTPHIGAILFQSGKFNDAQMYYEQLLQH